MTACLSVPLEFLSSCSHHFPQPLPPLLNTLFLSLYFKVVSFVLTALCNENSEHFLNGIPFAAHWYPEIFLSLPDARGNLLFLTKKLISVQIIQCRVTLV